jgi:hypothetical protein
MQPHVIFPILIFAFGMGVFLSTFVGDITQDKTEIKNSDVELITKSEALRLNAEKNISDNKNITSKDSWITQLQTSNKQDYHYPVTEVSMKLAVVQQVEKNITIPNYSISTGYLEPYHNFCVNQVLNEQKGIKYKIIESGDKIKFIINSTNKSVIDNIIRDLKYHDIETTRK